MNVVWGLVVLEGIDSLGEGLSTLLEALPINICGDQGEIYSLLVSSLILVSAYLEVERVGEGLQSCLK